MKRTTSSTCLAAIVAVVFLTTANSVTIDSAIAQCGPGGCRVDQGGPGSVSPGAALRHESPGADFRHESPRGHYRSVVRIQTVDRDGSRSFGSGVAVRWGRRVVILTARHVVKDARRVWVRGVAKYVEARVVGVDATWDVAGLVPSDESEFVAAQIAWRESGHPAPGEPLESCGFGGDDRLAVNRGRFLGYRAPMGSRGRTDWLVMSGQARQGDSGGPVFNQNRELVGILWGCAGGEVVATQCGRLHVFLTEKFSPPSAETEPRPSGSGLSRLADAVTAVPKLAGAAATGDVPASNRAIDDSSNQAGAVEGLPILANQRLVQNLLGSNSTASSQRIQQAVHQPLLPLCRPRMPEPPPAPQIIIRPDPHTESIDRKMDLLIEQKQEAAEREQADEASPVLLFLVIGGCVVLGIIVYFATQKDV
ncbi:MAG TPA: hypothetical protein DD670_15650 [Planctomycetaceae bacterium]|nr:hypothetical protein [Planctomycetaceae bacterium]